MLGKLKHAAVAMSHIRQELPGSYVSRHAFGITYFLKVDWQKNSDVARHWQSFREEVGRLGAVEAKRFPLDNLDRFAEFAYGIANRVKDLCN